MVRDAVLPPAPPMPVAEQAGHLHVYGIDMYHAVFGAGDRPPVVLIHAGLAHADSWAEQVADLMADRRVIVADSRGHGRSTSVGPPDYDLLTADWTALIAACGPGPVDIVGWSDGAIIGLRIALERPDCLRRLVAFAGNVTLDGLNLGSGINAGDRGVFAAAGRGLPPPVADPR